MNLDDGSLSIRRTLTYVAGHGYKEAEPKTVQSRRNITLPQFVLEVLKKHRAQQIEAQQKEGITWQDNGLVFCTASGSLIPLVTLRRRFQKVLKDAGLPHMRFHDLRHSAATILLGMGVNVKVVQELLGHSQISMTLGTHSHVLPSMHKNAMDKWDVAFRE